jgi:CPA2 family monovalent cation:H+ antiporter-2
LARRLDERDDPLSALPASTDAKFLARQVVIVGYGRVGRRIAEALNERNIPYVVAEQNRERVEQLRAAGIPAVYGDATDPMVLVQSHIEKANMLVITTPDTVGVRSMVNAARRVNPSVEVLIRSHNEAEADLFEKEGVGKVFLGENELAQAMIRHVLGVMKK